MRLNFPSGLAIEANKIKGEWLRKLSEQADGAGSENDDFFGELLGGCWKETLDAGPYPFVAVGDTRPTWKRLLKGDILVATVRLKIQSKTDGGDDFDFDFRCEAAECRKKVEWTVKLSDLPILELPKESCEKLRANEPFEDVVGGKKVRYHLASFSQDDEAKKIAKRDKRPKPSPIDTLAAQIVSVEGIPPDSLRRMRWLESLDYYDDVEPFMARIAEKDCGIDTAIEVRCPHCGWEQEVAVPLLNRRFFFKRRRRQEKPEPTETLDESETGSGGDGSSASPSTGGGASPSS